jgi:uncharacterized protein (TIGR03067 family)
MRGEAFMPWEDFSMRLWLVMVLATSLATATEVGGEGGPANRAVDLGGKWKVVRLEFRGIARDSSEVDRIKVHFTGERMIVRLDHDATEAFYRVDPSHRPRHIDVSHTDGPDRGHTFQGIYALDRDELRMCMDEGARKRPTDFVSAAGASITLIILRRERQ